MLSDIAPLFIRVDYRLLSHCLDQRKSRMLVKSSFKKIKMREKNEVNFYRHINGPISLTSVIQQQAIREELILKYIILQRKNGYLAKCNMPESATRQVAETLQQSRMQHYSTPYSMFHRNERYCICKNCDLKWEYGKAKYNI